MRFIKFVGKFATETDLKLEDMGIKANMETEDADIYIDVERIFAFNDTGEGTVSLRMDTGDAFEVSATIEDVYNKITGHE